eukprot:gene13704-4004_t
MAGELGRELKDIKDLLDSGAIEESDYTEMKAKAIACYKG